VRQGDARVNNTVTTSKIQAEEIRTPSQKGTASSAKVILGHHIPPQQQILLYSPDDWEEFTHEWVHYQKSKYKKVIRLSGASDMGIDVAGLTDDAGLSGVWDNYQCKHYAEALTPRTALLEIGKMLWHSFEGNFVLPRRYYFMAPKGCGISLTKLLASPHDLKEKLLEKWDDWCATKITTTQTIALSGKFAAYVQGCDFSIFTFKTALEAIEEHRKTPYYATRFGGGLPDRPAAGLPPTAPTVGESRYIQQLF
jgi:hypothetical protein